MSNDDVCAVCGEGGNLVCCDSCPQSFHAACAGLGDVPEDEWYCEDCCSFAVDFVDDSELKPEDEAFVHSRFRAFHDAYEEQGDEGGDGAGDGWRWLWLVESVCAAAAAAIAG